jgi:hypothetical protein
VATKTWAEFLPWVLPDVKDCPPVIARSSVRDAAIEFCERSRAYRLKLDPIDVDANEPVIELEVPTETRILLPVRVVYNGKPIDPVIPKGLDVTNPGWDSTIGDVFGYTMEDQSSIRLVLTPACSIVDGLNVELALKPSRAATAIDEEVFEKYVDEIASGAKWKLMSMADKQWTNATKAKEHKDRFDMACGDANVFAERGMTDAPMRTRPIYSLG